MSKVVRVVDVVLEVRVAGAGGVYTYEATADTAVGQAVLAPLGSRTVLGFVVQVREVPEEELPFDRGRLRPLSASVQGLALPPPLVELVERIAETYLTPLPSAMVPAVPPGVSERLVTSWTRTGGGATDLPLSALQREALALIDDLGEIVESKEKPLTASVKRALKLLRGKGLVAANLRLEVGVERHRLKGLLRLTRDGAAVEHFLDREGKKKPAQAMALIRLQGAGEVPFSAQELKALCSATDQTIKALIASGLVEQLESAPEQYAAPPRPNAHQREAIEAIVAEVTARRPQGFLLFGVTGSGKTEVYLRSAAEALKQGRQVLYLVPEIALTTQVVARLRERFGRNVAVMHSELPAADRLANWTQIATGEAAVVLGPRSALFMPLGNIGLIIVDEEHEGSYKQESAPRYHGRDVAHMLAEIHSCPIVLGSATPSAETYWAATQGELRLLTLPGRAAAGAVLPQVSIEDLTEGYRAHQPTIFSPVLANALRETLEEGHQAILFLNRRAYAPFLLCRECGHQFSCPNCAVSLSFHRLQNRLRCHQCDFSAVPPPTCPICSSEKITPFGVGVERVAEALTQLLPSARIGRLDRDAVRKKGVLEDTLASFRSRQLDILVGTQMVAKGLDFPHVTLVGVVAADITLNIPDFRSSERTFQLLSQVAGRAGRGAFPGRVIIQTFNPNHPAITQAASHEYEGFMFAVLGQRREAGYPPFSRLVNIVISGEDLAAVTRVSGAIASRIAGLGEPHEMLGPANCALERLRSLWRRHVMVKLPPGFSAAGVGHALHGLDTQGTQVVVDVDPQTLI